MSPLGNALANWLKTSPGAIKGQDGDEVLAKAYKAFTTWLGHTHYEIDEFKDGLARAGYEPQARTNHGDGGDFAILALPEKFKGL